MSYIVVVGLAWGLAVVAMVRRWRLVWACWEREKELTLARLLDLYAVPVAGEKPAPYIGMYTLAQARDMVLAADTLADYGLDQELLEAGRVIERNTVSIRPLAWVDPPSQLFVSEELKRARRGGR